MAQSSWMAAPSASTLEFMVQRAMNPGPGEVPGHFPNAAIHTHPVEYARYLDRQRQIQNARRRERLARDARLRRMESLARVRLARRANVMAWNRLFRRG